MKVAPQIREPFTFVNPLLEKAQAQLAGARAVAKEATLAAKRLAERDAEVVRLSTLLMGRRDAEIELLCRAIAARAAGEPERDAEEAVAVGALSTGADVPAVVTALALTPAGVSAELNPVKAAAPDVVTALAAVSAEIPPSAVATAAAAPVGTLAASDLSSLDKAEAGSPHGDESAPLDVPNGEAAAKLSAAKAPPAPWVKKWSASRAKVYYFNPTDGECVWKCPR